jgi:SAM-dependent methyltransferase
VFRFLTPDRLAASEPLVRQYRAVRAREGYLGRTAEYYRMLPCVPPDDPHAAEWRIRAESFQQLQRFALPPGGSAAIRVLDLGAGNGWLSHRLSSLGHHVVALDRLDDGEDGLGACCHYPTPFLRVQADFDALPFVPNQFDLVVFNGSLHYAPDVPATLARARRMIARHGALAVMDSPMFRRDEDGLAMVADKLRRFKTDYGLTEIVHPSVGFLTPSSLSGAVAPLGLGGRFVRSRGPLRWRVGRELARVRLRRAPAAFGVWIARAAPGEAR